MTRWSPRQLNRREQLPGRLIRNSIPLAGEFGSRVDDAKALALKIALRAAGRLRDAHREVAAGCTPGFESSGNQGSLHSTPAKFGQSAHSEESGDSLSNSERSATDGFPVDIDQVRREA